MESRPLLQFPEAIMEYVVSVLVMVALVLAEVAWASRRRTP